MCYRRVGWKKHEDLHQTHVIPSDVAGYWIDDLLKHHQSPTLTTKRSSQSDNGVTRQQRALVHSVVFPRWLQPSAVFGFGGSLSGDHQRCILSHSATTLHSVLVAFSSRSGVKMFTPLGSSTWPSPQQLFYMMGSGFAGFGSSEQARVHTEAHKQGWIHVNATNSCRCSDLIMGGHVELWLVGRHPCDK